MSFQEQSEQISASTLIRAQQATALLCSPEEMEQMVSTLSHLEELKAEGTEELAARSELPTGPVQVVVTSGKPWRAPRVTLLSSEVRQLPAGSVRVGEEITWSMADADPQMGHVEVARGSRLHRLARWIGNRIARPWRGLRLQTRQVLAGIGETVIPDDLVQDPGNRVTAFWIRFFSSHPALRVAAGVLILAAAVGLILAVEAVLGGAR